MLHVRRTLSKQEREEYQRWLEKHRSPSPVKPQDPETYWAKQAALDRQLNSLRVTTAHLKSGPTVTPNEDAPRVELTPEQEAEQRKREEQARRVAEERKQRTGPVYNKGGAVYWTEEMLKDLTGGGHRRR